MNRIRHSNVRFATMVHICDCKCSIKSEMNKHIATVHDWTKPSKCDICGYSFSQKGDMKIHILLVHEGKKSFKCDILTPLMNK